MDVAESVGVGVDCRGDQFKPFKERVGGGGYSKELLEEFSRRRRRSHSFEDTESLCLENAEVVRK